MNLDLFFRVYIFNIKNSMTCLSPGWNAWHLQPKERMLILGHYFRGLSPWSESRRAQQGKAAQFMVVRKQRGQQCQTGSPSDMDLRVALRDHPDTSRTCSSRPLGSSEWGAIKPASHNTAVQILQQNHTLNQNLLVLMPVKESYTQSFEK